MEPVPVLRAVGLSKAVGSGRARRRVLHEVSLDVAAGEVVAVLGPSGSGKSTLLQLLGGLDRPDEGTIELAGAPLEGRGDRALARARLRHVGFVFQQFQLVEECSGLENVLMPTRLPGAPAGGPDRAHSLIEDLGLAQVSGHLPHELSGGEQQRVAIARAMVNRPKLLLADEPTGNLDPSTSVGIMRLLDRINRQGTTVVMATHDDEIVDQMRKRVIELKAGEVVRDQARGVYGFQH